VKSISRALAARAEFPKYTTGMADRLRLYQAFGQNPDNIGWLIEDDIFLTFPQLLAAWMDYEETTSIPAFLTRIRVNEITEIITERQFRNLHAGIQVIGPQLATVLAMHLPDGIMRPEKKRTFYPKFYGFRNRARRWRAFRESKMVGGEPITQIELEPRVIDDFSGRFLDKLLSSQPVVPAIADIEESVTPKELPQTEPILVALESFAAQQCRTRGYEAISLEEMLENLYYHYLTEPGDAINSVNALLQARGAEPFIETDIEIFFESLEPASDQTLDRKQALVFLRQINGWSQLKLARRLGVGAHAIQNWEAGRCNIGYENLSHFAALLTPSQAKGLILFMRPDMLERVDETWLDAQIEQQKWDNLWLPALDRTWLDAQDPDKQPGLLLRDLRVTKQLTREQLARRIGVSPNAVRFWETAKRTIAYTSLGGLAAVFSGRETKRLIILVRPTIIEYVSSSWLDAKISQAAWETISFPAIDEDWLDAQPEYLRGGLLFRAFRERARLTESELDIRNGYVWRMESSQGIITDSKISGLQRSADLSPREVTRLRLVVSRSNTAIKYRIAQEPVLAVAVKCSPRARFEEQLHMIEEQFELELSSDPEDPRNLLDRILAETEIFLLAVAPVINRATQGSRRKNNLFRDGMEVHFPDLHARFVAVRQGLETRIQELIPPRIEDLCARYEDGLGSVEQRFEQQKSRARLQDLRTLRNTLVEVTDKFLNDLAKTIGFRTEGSRWRVQVLREGKKHFPDPQRVHQLVQRSKSIGKELGSHIEDQIYADAHNLCTTFHGKLKIWQDQFQNQHAELEKLETLSAEARAVTDEFLKSVAALIEYTTEGGHWRNNLISHGLRQHLSRSVKTIAEPPSRRVRSLYDETRALEMQITRGIQEKKRPGQNPERTRRSNIGQPHLKEVADSSSAAKAPAATGDDCIRMGYLIYQGGRRRYRQESRSPLFWNGI
jgi:transcriptional regulator with XRE-family HTH domain